MSNASSVRCVHSFPALFLHGKTLAPHSPWAERASVSYFANFVHPLDAWSALCVRTVPFTCMIKLSLPWPSESCGRHSILNPKEGADNEEHNPISCSLALFSRLDTSRPRDLDFLSSSSHGKLWSEQLDSCVVPELLRDPFAAAGQCSRITGTLKPVKKGVCSTIPLLRGLDRRIICPCRSKHHLRKCCNKAMPI